MFNHKIDILNLEYPHLDRDRHIITPIYVYLREKYKLNIKSENIFNGYFYLLKYRPKMLLISNSVGGDVNFLIAKAAYKTGVKVVSLISEGNFEEKQTDAFLWGWNTDKILYEDAKILWSERSRNIFSKKYPELADRFYVSGGTGFDRYKLLKFMSKEHFLSKNNLGRYKKIIGVAGWGFDSFFEGDTWECYKSLFIKVLGKEQVKMHRKDLFLLRKIYKKLIEKNQDILFILRYHPLSTNFEKTEFPELKNYENVYISNPITKQNDLKISDLINVSDLWIGYNSTTLLEAWLLGKTAFLINPTRSDFIRDNISKGSPVVSTYTETQGFIDKFFISGKINEFDAMREARKKVKKDVIEYEDGKNHIRAAEIIYKIFLENNDRTKGINYLHFPFLRMLRQSFGFYRTKFFTKYDIASEVKYYEKLYLKSIKNEINRNTTKNKNTYRCKSVCANKVSA